MGDEVSIAPSAVSSHNILGIDFRLDGAENLNQLKKKKNHLRIGRRWTVDR